jgi:aminoglycoside phosphotransferase family enzyme
MKKKNKAWEIWERYNFKMIPQKDCEDVLNELEAEYKKQGDEEARRALLPFFLGYKAKTSYNVTRLMQDSAFKRDGMGVI